MSVPFPSVEFFESLRKQIADDPGSMAEVEPSEAYCGFAIGDNLFVLEFDGRRCAAIANGGNTLDLDFFLSGPTEVWQETIESIQKPGGVDDDHTLEALIERGRNQLCSEAEDGEALGRTALKFLQAFLDQAKSVEVRAG